MSGSDQTGSGEDDEGKNSLLDRWHIARDIIKHEDDLYDQRLRSLLTLHGFLFTSVAVVVSIATNDDHQAYSVFLFLFLLVLCFVGYRTACRVHDPLKAARQQVAVAALWWTWTAEGKAVGRCERAGCESYQSHFPPIIGGKEYYDRYSRELVKAGDDEQHRSSKPFQPLERFLRGVWLVMLVLMLVMAVIFGLYSHNRCIHSLTATATASNTPSNGWWQHVRCFVMPLSHRPSASSKAPGGAGQAGCAGTQP